MMDHLLNALTRPPAGRTVSVSGENVYGKPPCHVPLPSCRSRLVPERFESDSTGTRLAERIQISAAAGRYFRNGILVSERTPRSVAGITGSERSGGDLINLQKSFYVLML